MQERIKLAVQCCSRAQRNPSVRTDAHQTPAPLEAQSRQPWHFDYQPMQNLVCIFTSRLEKIHIDKHMCLTQEISDRVFRAGSPGAKL